MRSESWEILIGVLFLVVCLIIGLGLGRINTPEPVIGLLRLEGVIDFDSAEFLIEVLDRAREDERVAGVVMEILSPGGFATSSESVYYSMLNLRNVKPLVTYIDGIAVSGGYYMSVASNRIYVPPSARVGNVGVRTVQPDDPGIVPQEISSGPFKLSGGSRFDRIHQLELVANSFVSRVVNQRANAVDNPLQISDAVVAEARIYLGSEAVAIGLADFEGGRSDAVLGAAELAGVDRYAVVDLADYVGVDHVVEQPPLNRAVKTLIENAPQDAIFMLDSRIPLVEQIIRSDLDEHLLSLRSVDTNPASQFRRPLENVPDFLSGLVPAGN
ncbi:S49 family peptidase [Chloroflexi bacterium TSY]|nr:S49 family peptidase [Chloroflexi bacterium TSY]